MKRLSVIIPCHNARAYVAETLDSLTRQVRPADEVIVVDDGSTDGSAELVAAHPLRPTLHRVAFGQACRARNYGLQRAQGELLMFLDADDLLGEEALQGLAAALAGTRRGLALGRWYRLEQVDGAWKRRPASVPPKRLGEGPLNAWLRGRYYPPCAVLWDREALEALGGWDETLAANQDGDLALRHLATGGSLQRARLGYSLYRRAPGSISSRRLSRDAVASRIHVLTRLASILQGRGRMYRHRAYLSHAFRTLAEEARALHPDLAETASSLAERHRPPKWETAWWHSQDAAGRELMRWANRLSL